MHWYNNEIVFDRWAWLLIKIGILVRHVPVMLMSVMIDTTALAAIH
jgi:hypothetical protein